MQNETKLSSEKIKSLLSTLKSGNADNLRSTLEASLNESQKQKINSVLSDPQKLKEILSSPQAKELIEKFSQSSNGDRTNGSP